MTIDATHTRRVHVLRWCSLFQICVSLYCRSTLHSHTAVAQNVLLAFRALHRQAYMHHRPVDAFFSSSQTLSCQNHLKFPKCVFRQLSSHMIIAMSCDNLLVFGQMSMICVGFTSQSVISEVCMIASHLSSQNAASESDFILNAPNSFLVLFSSNKQRSFILLRLGLCHGVLQWIQNETLQFLIPM